MFKLVARAQILVIQGGEIMDGGARAWGRWKKMRPGLGQREYCEAAESQ